MFPRILNVFTVDLLITAMFCLRIWQAIFLFKVRLGVQGFLLRVVEDLGWFVTGVLGFIVRFGQGLRFWVPACLTAEVGIPSKKEGQAPSKKRG